MQKKSFQILWDYLVKKKVNATNIGGASVKFNKNVWNLNMFISYKYDADLFR